MLPQWNADADGHIGLCQLLARFGMSALRLSLPYHDARMPPELQRADYIVSSNVVRTLQVCRQAVLDARRAIDWLRRKATTIGILGTSLGSCLSMLTAAHEPRIRAAALNHVSPCSPTSCGTVCPRATSARVSKAIRPGRTCATLWLPISPQPYLDACATRRPARLRALRPDLPGRALGRCCDDFRARAAARIARAPCGHYSTGKAPFKFLDGAVLTRFLYKNL